MNCRDTESLILAERDGALTSSERAALSDHLTACPACRELRRSLAASLEAYRTSTASVRLPDVDAEWRELESKLPASRRGTRRRPLAPVVWFGAPVAAAAAALAMVFLVGGSPFSSRPASDSAATEASTALLARGSAPAEAMPAASFVPPPPPPPPPMYDPSIIAGADYVEAGNPNAATLVYVDNESGWLVVWATDLDAPPSG